MILLWLRSQQWRITISIMATAWNHNCKCICFPFILVLVIQAPCYGSITKEQRFLADLFPKHSGSTHCFFAFYSFKCWEFGMKGNSLSDTMCLVIKCVHSIKALVSVLRLFCAACDRRDNTPFPCLSKFPEMTDLHAPTNTSVFITVPHLSSKGLKTVPPQPTRDTQAPSAHTSFIWFKGLAVQTPASPCGHLFSCGNTLMLVLEMLFGFHLYPFPHDKN